MGNVSGTQNVRSSFTGLKQFSIGDCMSHMVMLLVGVTYSPCGEGVVKAMLPGKKKYVKQLSSTKEKTVSLVPPVATFQPLTLRPIYHLLKPLTCHSDMSAVLIIESAVLRPPMIAKAKGQTGSAEHCAASFLISFALLSLESRA